MTPDDALHSWMYSARRYGPATVAELMAEIESIRSGGVPLADLPKDGISLVESLKRLQVAGKATRDGSYWRWAEPAAATRSERRLF